MWVLGTLRSENLINKKKSIPQPCYTSYVTPIGTGKKTKVVRLTNVENYVTRETTKNDARRIFYRFFTSIVAHAI